MKGRLISFALSFGLSLVLLILTVRSGLCGFLTEDELKRLFLQEFKAKLSFKEETLRVERFRVEPREITLRSGQPYLIDWITPPRAGSNTAVLTFMGQDGEPKTLRLWGYVEVLKKVPILARSVQAGEILTAEHVSLSSAELSRLPHDVIFDHKVAIGKQVRMSLREGTVLRTSHLQLPALVKRNEEVEILAKGQSFVIKAKGVALENGCLGEIIRVKNKESGKVIFAKVVEDRVVEVNF